MPNLKDIAQEAGILLTDQQEKDFMFYCDLLLEWNQKMNLTAITDVEEVYKKHFVDSIVVLQKDWIKEGATLIDVGSGAGFPGMPISIMRPDVTVVFADSLRKRLDFLREVSEKLNNKRVSFVHGRAEDLGRKKEYREQFDIATARAVAGMPVLLEYTLPFVRPNGAFLAWKGPKGEDELSESTHALEQLGGQVDAIHTLELFDTTRSMINIKKIKPTPGRYPRQPKKIQEKPL